MWQDNFMAMDCMEMKKHSSVTLTNAASECSNTQLRQTLIQMRGACEQAQQEIAQISTSNGWYLPAENADQHEISKVKSFFQNQMSGITGVGAGAGMGGPGGMMR